jgi:hypothetical protein
MRLFNLLFPIAACQAPHTGVTFQADTIESLSVEELNVSPWQNQFDNNANMDPGRIDDWSDPHMSDSSLIVWKGADWSATRLSGIDATDVADGDVRWFANLSQSGIDAGQIVLLHDSEFSDEDNRVLCPGAKDFPVPIFGGVELRYKASVPGMSGGRWIVMSSNGWANQSVMSMLSLYPSLKIPQLAAGTYDDFDPAGDRNSMYIDEGFGIAGTSNLFKDYSVVKIPVAAGGAVITGLGGINGSNDLAADWGPVKFLMNYGPGDLTLMHQHAGSDVEHRMYLPQSRPLRLRPNETAIVFAPMQDSTGYDVGWRVLALSQSFLTANSRDTVSAGLVSDFEPSGAGDIVEIQATAPASVLDGLVPLRVANSGLSSNEIRVIKNVGDVPLYIVDRASSSSDVANRFRLPGAQGATTAPPPLAIPPGSSVAFQYTYNNGDLYWVPLGLGSVQPLANSGASITPSALSSGSVDDYASSDATTGLAGRWVHVWIVQGHASGTSLTGIDRTPSGVPSFEYGDRVLLLNYGSNMTIKDFTTSTLENRFRLPGGDKTLKQWGSLEVMWTGAWLPVGGVPN